MPKPYSNDLRARVIGAVNEGASRREVAERFEVGISTVVVWAQRWKETGSVAAKPSGGRGQHKRDERSESLPDVLRWLYDKRARKE